MSLVARTVITNPQEVEAIGVQDAIENSYTVISGVVNAAQSIKIMQERNNGKMSAADVFDALFSDPSQLQMEYMLEDIYAGVGRIEGKVDKIDEKVQYLIGRNETMYKSLNSSLYNVNKKLNQQSKTLSQIKDTLDNVLKKQISVKNQINSMRQSINSQIETAVDTLSTAIYGTTSGIKNFTALMNAISTYYSSFDGLNSVEQTILGDLKNKHTDYEAFFEAVGALDNGSDIIKVLDKITVNYEESYNALTEEEKELLNTKVKVPGYSEMTIEKFYSDYMKNMYTYMSDTIYDKSSGYTSNIYDTSIFMGKYILGQEAATGNIPIGELYYQLSMVTCENSDMVHKAYLDFRDSVLQQYYTTAYLCELSLFYMISHEKAYGGNSSEIKTYEEHLDTLYQQMQQIYAYADYEENNCQLKYDFNGYIDSDYHKYLCYYGNSINSEKGIKNWKCVPKKDVYISGGLSEDRMTLAIYPKQSSYIKVTSLPELVKDENGTESLSGGKITIYNNKDEVVEVKDISECAVSLLADKSKYVISYNNMTTCLGIASLSVYTNGLKTEEAVEFLEDIRFLEGTKTNRDEILKDIIELPSGEETVRYKLLGSSLEEGDFTVNKDMSVLTLYVSEASLLEHEHEYLASFDWEEDGSGCAVTLTCQNDKCNENTEGYKITDICTVTSAVKTPATCNSKGTTTYTATYTLNGVNYTDNKEIDDIEKLKEHTYENGVCSHCNDILTMTVDGIIYKVVTQTDTTTGKPVGQTIIVSGSDTPQVAVSVIGTDNTFTTSGSDGKVYIPSSVTGSGSLQNFVVTKISENAFSTAEVTEIVIPATVSELETGALGGATTVSFNGNTAPKGIANAITDNTTVNVPEGAGESFKEVLGESANIVEAHTHKYADTWTYNERGHWKATTCGHDSEEGVLDIKAHTFGEWTETKSATEDEKGSKERSCACGYRETADIDKLAHTIHVKDNGTRVEPTCEEKGSITYKCTKCGEVVEIVELDAIGHSYTSKVTKVATITNTGIRTYTCTRCGHKYTEVIPKLPIVAPSKGKKLTDTTHKAVFTVTKAGKVTTSKGTGKVTVTAGEVAYTKSTNTSATTLTIPSTVKINGITYKVTSIGANAFANNKKLTRVTIGSNVKTIGSKAFYRCTKLKTVKIGKNVTTIGANAFYGCAKLDTVSVGAKVATISDKAFYKCTALKTITIPATVKKIGKQAFYGCKKLKTVTIKTTKLSNGKVGSKAFTGIYAKATVKVPKTKYVAYKKLLKAKGLGAKAIVKK